ncbi:MAG: hypothetical protein E7134_01420 [Rikenellaceae bacterium]|nr:hypothetical protein [Rikenellaceae bacterium]
MKKRFFDFAKGVVLAIMGVALLSVGCTPDQPVDPGTKPEPPTPGDSTEVVVPDISKIDINKTWPLISTLPSFVSGDSTTDAIIVVNAAGSALEEGGVDIYAHTGVITDKSTSGSDWKYVKHDWSENAPECKLTHVGGTIYAMTIAGGPRAFYGVPEGEIIEQLAFVFREEYDSSDPNFSAREIKNNGSDIYVDMVDESVLAVKILAPSHGTILPIGAIVDVVAVSQNSQSLALKLNGAEVKSVDGKEITYQHTVATGGDMVFEAVATADNGDSISESVTVAALKATESQTRPAGAKDGVTVSGTEATVVLYAPGKEQIVLLGDFNKFAPSNDYVMYKDGDYFWTTVSGLQPNTEYGYQFLVDGKMKVGDPYCEKILDPWNDVWIDPTVYPNLKAYPTNTTEIVSVFSTSTDEYNWQVKNFDRPDKNSLAIYELLLRDFTPEGSVKAATAKLDYLETLGINAIELMPIQEFDGNNSWGYNPCFYFAPDKAYGTEADYKEFIDECHKRGIAVILDIVLNHATGQFPWMKMWSDDGAYPNAQNPFFNTTAKHPHNVYNDINHNYPKTREYFSDMLKFWIEEYNIDGYRFDLAKGLTQTDSGNDDGRCQQYDANRVEILKHYCDAIKSVADDAYIILEYFVCDQEENEMAAYGAIPWRNAISGYQETVMGWYDSGQNKSYFGRAYAKDRVSYMESHDEDRVAFKAISWGNTGVRNWENLSSRISAAMAFHFLTPYPKMMWQGGELGDDRELTEEGRTDAKPFRWEDLNDANRKSIYDAASKVISFRTDHPELYGDGASNNLNIYKVSDSDMGGKHLVYTSGGSTVIVAANFREGGSNGNTGGGTTTTPTKLVYTEPEMVSQSTTSDVVVYLNTTGTALADYSGNIYAHTGVLTSASADETDWKYVKHEWTENGDDCKLTKVEANLWKLTIKGGPRAFYGVPEGEQINTIMVVFRNEDGSKEVKDNGADIKIPVYVNGGSSASFVYTEPEFVSQSTTDDVVVYLNTTGTALANYSGSIYAHTGVLTDASANDSDWKYVKHEWTENSDECKLTKVEANLWKLTITGGPRAFYGVPSSTTIKKIAFVFRNENGTKEVKNNGGDIFISLMQDGDKQQARAAAASSSTVEFDIECPNGTYTNLITGEQVTVSGGKYHNALDPHEYIVLTKVN